MRSRRGFNGVVNWFEQHPISSLFILIIIVSIFSVKKKKKKKKKKKPTAVSLWVTRQMLTSDKCRRVEQLSRTVNVIPSSMSFISYSSPRPSYCAFLFFFVLNKSQFYVKVFDFGFSGLKMSAFNVKKWVLGSKLVKILFCKDRLFQKFVFWFFMLKNASV